MWPYGTGGYPHVMHHQPAPAFVQQVVAVPCTHMRGPCSHRVGRILSSLAFTVRHAVPVPAAVRRVPAAAAADALPPTV